MFADAHQLSAFLSDLFTYYTIVRWLPVCWMSNRCLDPIANTSPKLWPPNKLFTIRKLPRISRNSAFEIRIDICLMHLKFIKRAIQFTGTCICSFDSLNNSYCTFQVRHLEAVTDVLDQFHMNDLRR